MADRQVDDTRLPVLTAVDVPHHPVVHRTLAPGDLPGVTRALVIDEKVAGMPAHDETQSPAGQLSEPGSTSKAPVPDMNHLLPPLFRALVQQGDQVGEPVGSQRAPRVHQRMAARAGGPK